MRRGSYRGRGYGSRYSGGGRGKAGVILGVVFVLALLGAAVWLIRSMFCTPAPAPTAVVLTSGPSPAATPTPTPEPPAPEFPEPPESLRGIYISGPVAGDPYMDALLELIDSTELNAVVIDVKNDEGNLTYRPDGGTAVEMGACVRYIRDLPGLVARLKEHGVYTIARIAAFKDPVLAGARPELALKKADGSAVDEGGGLAWVNPYEQAVWEYLIEVALGAAEAGFDEVQFDYVRFPTGKGARDADYGAAAGEMSREDAVLAFLEQAGQALHRRGVWLAADVFGTVITSRTDGELIGQDYARMGGVADFLCPMVYPSHYAGGAFGLEVPDREPYQTVLSALEKSRAVLDMSGEEDRPGVRVWLQDFTATWVQGHITYGGEELRAQIQAVYDAGYTDWILWNAKNSYTADGLLGAAEGKAG